MGSVCKVILLGRVGKDPELKQVRDSTVCNFPIATTESYKDKSGNRVDQTEWHNIQFWNEQAKVIEKFVKKGHELYVEGTIKTETWEDNGVKKYAVKIKGTSFVLMNNKKEGETHVQGESSQRTETPIQSQETDDLPF